MLSKQSNHRSPFHQPGHLWDNLHHILSRNACVPFPAYLSVIFKKTCFCQAQNLISRSYARLWEPGHTYTYLKFHPPRHRSLCRRYQFPRFTPFFITESEIVSFDGTHRSNWSHTMSRLKMTLLFSHVMHHAVGIAMLLPPAKRFTSDVNGPSWIVGCTATFVNDFPGQTPSKPYLSIHQFICHIASVLTPLFEATIFRQPFRASTIVVSGLQRSTIPMFFCFCNNVSYTVPVYQIYHFHLSHQSLCRRYLS